MRISTRALTLAEVKCTFIRHAGSWHWRAVARLERRGWLWRAVEKEGRSALRTREKVQSVALAEMTM